MEDNKRAKQLAGILTENFDAIDGVIRTEITNPPVGAKDVNDDVEAIDKVAAMGIMEDEKIDIDLKTSDLILPALKKAGLDSYLNEINDFDIAEAVATYTHNYNEDIDTIHKLNQLLRDVEFKASPYFSYNEEDLEDMSKMVYDALIDYYQNDGVDENKAEPAVGQPAPKDETPVQHTPITPYNESVRLMVRNIIKEII